MFDTLIHRFLRIPYTLHVDYVHRPKNPRATVLFLHGIGNSGAAWSEVIKAMPDDIQVITIDLLGFGNSPKPKWPVYNAKAQARAALATLFKLRVHSRIILVGHSLGALVAVEMARRYPVLIRSMVLCSPPFYNVTDTSKHFLPSNDRTLRRMYNLAKDKPDQFLQITAFAMKYNLINESFNVTTENIDSYMATLESMIINQTSYTDAFSIKIPTTILKGTLDPLVISKNIRAITKANKLVTAQRVIASHEIRGLFVPAVVKAIKQQLINDKQSDITKLR